MTSGRPAREENPDGRRRVRRWQVVLFLVVLAVAAIIYPPSFRWALKNYLWWEALRAGYFLEIGVVGGSLWEPLVLSDVRFRGPSEAGVELAFSCGKLVAQPAWRRVLTWREGAWFREVAVETAAVRVDIRAPDSGAPAGWWGARRRSGGRGMTVLGALFPESLRVADSSVTVRAGARAAVASGVRIATGDLEEGLIEAAVVRLEGRDFRREFRDLRGKTFLKGGRLDLSRVRVADDFEIASATALLKELFAGVLQVEFQANAFGGVMRGQARNVWRGGRGEVEVIGSFTGLSVARFAAFVGDGQEADGQVDDGRFTFRGAPGDLDTASLMVRFGASGFRWGKRQWDALTVGATLVERRVRVMELRLKQTGNAISLVGEMELPRPGQGWLDTEFAFDVEAEIGDLAGLARLGGAWWGEMAGRLEVSGAVRNRGGSLGGQLVARGKKLSWKGVPVDVLDAAVKIEDDEVQAVNITLAHGTDYLRLRGGVKIRGERVYAGEVRMAVEELARYAPWMGVPALVVPVGGSVRLEWAGDGSEQAHSGAFRAEFQGVRPLAGAVPMAGPAAGEVEGTYSPGNVFLTRCTLLVDGVRASAAVGVAPTKVELRDFRLEQAGRALLVGEATVPADLWSAWPAVQWRWQDPVLGRVVATGFDLGVLGRFWVPWGGWSGAIDGEVKVGGTLAAVAGDGKLAWREVRGGGLAPWSGEAVLQQQRVMVKGGPVAVGVWPGLGVAGGAELAVEWGQEGLAVTGTVAVDRGWLEGGIPLELLLGAQPWPAVRWLPAVIDRSGVRCGLVARTAAPVPVVGAAAGKIAMDLTMASDGRHPAVTGWSSIEGIPVSGAAGPLQVESGGLFWLGSGAEAPVLNLRADGVVDGYRVGVYWAGEVAGGEPLLVSEVPLAESSIRNLLRVGTAAAGWSAGGGLADWPTGSAGSGGGGGGAPPESR